MKRFICLFTLLCITATLVAETTVTPPNKPKEFDDLLFSWIDTFAEVAHLVKQKHFKVQDLEACMINAIEAFVTTLDPHSGFLSPKSYKNIMSTMSGEFCGIGIVIDATRQTKERHLTIVDVIPDGPADKIGIKPLDKIVEIEGQTLEGVSTDEAIAKLKGKKDTIVHIKVLRDQKSELLSFEIKRDVIKDQNTICFYLPDYNICYISLTMFNEKSVNSIEKLLESANKKQYKGLVLDLRNNSGGLLQSAIDIVGLFVDKGSVVVTTKDKNNKELDRYATKRQPLSHTPPFIIILINNYTASAAEILAGCLKIHAESSTAKTKPIVVLVGTRTFGKGSVQEIIPVSNECAAKITTTLYFLPDGNSIQGVGIEPDVNVEKKIDLPEHVAWFNQHYGHEQALANYIKQNNEQNKKEEDIKKEAEKPKNWAERSKEMLSKDNQFLDAVSILNVLNSAKELMPAGISNRKQAVSFLKKNYATGEKLNMAEIKI
jgi:carboxyl-terminal processing protease